MRVHTKVLGLLMATVLLAAACSGRGDDAEGTGDTTAPTDETTAVTEPQEPTEATEIGITEDEIRVGIIADVDSPLSPGASQPLVDAMEGWVADVNERGGLAGREVVLDFYDSHLSPDDSNAAILEACANDFALVGSAMFTLIDSTPLAECEDLAGNATGLPELAALAISTTAAGSGLTYPVVGTGQDFSGGGDPAEVPFDIGMGEVNYAIEEQGDLTLLPVNTGIPGIEEVQLRNGRAQTQVGATVLDPVVFPDAAPQAQATPLVAQIESEGVNFVESISVGVGKLMAEARVQGLDMESVHWSCTQQCMVPTFLEQNGDAVEGLYVTTIVSPLGDTEVEGVAAYLAAVGEENASTNGINAYAQGLNFEQMVNTLVEEGGVNNLTRASLVELLESGPEVSAAGILPPGFVLGGTGRDCFVLSQVQGGEFTRVTPTEPGEFDCSPDNAVEVAP